MNLYVSRQDKNFNKQRECCFFDYECDVYVNMIYCAGGERRSYRIKG